MVVRSLNDRAQERRRICNKLLRIVKGTWGFVCGRPVQNIAGFVLRVRQNLEAQTADCMVNSSVIFGQYLGVEHMVSI